MEKAKVTFRIPKYIEDADEDFFTNAFQQKRIIQHNVKVKVINYVPEKKGPGMCCDIGFYELEYTSYNSKAPRLVCAKFTPRLPKPNWEAFNCFRLNRKIIFIQNWVSKELSYA